MRMLINGQKVAAKDGKESKIYNPATQEFIDSVPLATQEDIEWCLEVAQEGKKLWAKTPLYERAKVLLKYADELEKYQHELAQLQCQEMGKPYSQCAFEVNVAVMLFRGFVERACHLYGETVPDCQPGTEKDILFTKREPLGVVACILPFNYPTELFAHKAAPALITGNAIVVKPASDNPLIIIRLVELLLECGIPGSVAQVITGKGSLIGETFGNSSKINAISLTGSTEAGINVMRGSATHLHRIMLELGGNDPLILFADGDINLAVNEAFAGRIWNSGQTCCACKRFLVENQVKEEFTAKLVDRLKQTITGDPLDPKTEIGCLINENAAINVEKQVAHTISQGARCVYGGKRYNKTFFEPTVLIDVTPEMDVAKDMEIFGPVFPIIGFDTMEEAVAIANNTQYGLCAGVITADINKGLKTMSMLENGTVVLNGSGFYRQIDQQFGGYKKSGIGREGISCTLEEMTQVKTYVLKGALK